MPTTVARWLTVLAAVGLLTALLPSAASASRPSTQAEIDGILAAVQRSPLLAKIPGRPFIVTQITVSTASAAPLFASGVVSPKNVAGRPRPPVDLLFQQNADGSWTLLEFGANLCGDAEVPRAVLLDLFGTACGGGSGGGSSPNQRVATLGTAVAGSTTATLVAVRGGRVGTVPRASVFLEISVGGGGGSAVVADQAVGRAGGFNFNLLNRPGGGGVIALASFANGPQYITVTVRKNARAYGTQSYTFAGGVLLPARGTLPTSS
jgi:hypothetical protein